MKNFIGYYKWHLIFLLLIIVCLVFVFMNVTTQVESDMIVGYVGTSYVNEQSFNDNRSVLEKLMRDASGDSKENAALIPYTVDLQKDVNELFAEVIETEAYHIYIASKETFEAYEDKSAFASMLSSTQFENLDVLLDSSGRIYAVSVEDNTLLRRLGFVETQGLYIAAADFGNDELSTQEKNGINVTSEIINKRKDY